MRPQGATGGSRQRLGLWPLEPRWGPEHTLGAHFQRGCGGAWLSHAPGVFSQGGLHSDHHETGSRRAWSAIEKTAKWRHAHTRRAARVRLTKTRARDAPEKPRDADAAANPVPVQRGPWGARTAQGGAAWPGRGKASAGLRTRVAPVRDDAPGGGSWEPASRWRMRAHPVGPGGMEGARELCRDDRR